MSIGSNGEKQSRWSRNGTAGRNARRFSETESADEIPEGGAEQKPCRSSCSAQSSMTTNGFFPRFNLDFFFFFSFFFMSVLLEVRKHEDDEIGRAHV